jgi:hypothetical protein
MRHRSNSTAHPALAHDTTLLRAALAGVLAALIAIGCSLALAPAARASAGRTSKRADAADGQITGKVTSAATSAPIEGVQVCAYTNFQELGPVIGVCAISGANGEYAISGLATGEYTVEFSVPSESTLDYIGQYYDDQSSSVEADTVTVTSGATTAGIDAALLAGGEITGKVTSAATSAPIAGIEACAYAASEELEFTVGCARTDAAGEYTLAGLPSGEYEVEFLSPYESDLDYLSQYYDDKSSQQEANLVTVTEGSTTASIDAALLAAGEITGKVTAANTKAPVEGIEVCATRTSNEYQYTERCASTDAAGEYTLAGLPTAEYSVEFSLVYESPLNFVNQYYDDKLTSAEANPVSVVAGSTVSGIDAALLTGGQITGKVTMAASGKAPIEDIEACTVGGAVSRCGVTNASGEYTISGLPSGEYKVEFFSESFESNYLTQYYDEKSSSSEATPVVVTAGVTTTGIDAALLTGGQITGKVTAADTKAAIAGVEVCATPSDEEVYEYGGSCATTNADGEYTISGLTSGEYKVEFTVRFGSLNYITQYYDDKQSRSEASPVAVTQGITAAGIDAALQPGGQITGTVTSAATASPVKDIEVCATASAYEYDEQTCADTNASGQYTLSRLTTGNYKVAFYADGNGLNYLEQYYDGKTSFAEASTVAVTTGAATIGVDAALLTGGQITGKVTSAATNVPLAYVYVCALSGGQQNCAITNARGEYTVEALASGKYTVEFSGSEGLNYLTQYYDDKASAAEAAQVSVTAGATTTGIDAAMIAGGQITGKVTSAATNAPLEDVEVCASPAAVEFGEQTCATSTFGGAYAISGLTSGEYKVSFEDNSFESDYLEQYYSGQTSLATANKVPVTAGSNTEGIDAALLAGGEITGKVTSAATKAAIAEISVCASTSGEDPVYRCTRTNASGEYTISTLTSGEYTVEFSSSPERGLNYLTQYYDDESSPSEASKVAVTVGKTTAAIDAELQAGGQITGKVTSQATKAAIDRVEVCATASANEYEDQTCTSTDASGEYTLSGLATGAYKVRFSAGGETPYVSQYYDDESSFADASPVAVVTGATATGIDAALLTPGQITGKVTAAAGKAAIEGIEVCASLSGGFFEQCSSTNASGEYTVSGLDTGEYTVEFYAPYGSGLNYLAQYYDDKPSASEANPVTVTAGSTTAAIDAALLTGGQITGKVTAADTKAAIAGIEVCASSTGEEYVYDCATTNASGEYAVPGLSGGQYVVEFASPYGSGLDYVTQYYDDQSSYEDANEVSVTAGAATAEIDAAMQASAAVKPANTEAPSISGEAAVDKALSCSPGTWTGTPAPTFTYEWLRDGSAIAGASASAYTVQTIDQGHAITCKVTATNTAGEASAESAAMAIPPEAAVKPADTQAPQLTGTAAVGQPLSCSAGSWTGTPAPTFAFQWLRDGSAIAGASTDSYIVQAADQGHAIVCKVTATNKAGEASAESAADDVPPEPAVKPANTAPPAITGGAALGQTLSCSPGTWSGAPTPTFAYQWLRDGSPIAGANADAYTIQEADQGHALACKVTAANKAGNASAESTQIDVPPASTSSGGPGSGGGSTNSNSGNADQGSGGVAGFTEQSRPVALAGAITSRSAAVLVPLRCPASSGACTAVTIELTVVEQLSKGRLTGVAAARAAKTLKRTVTIGALTATLSAGQTKTVSVVLNAAGKALLHSRGKLLVKVQILAGTTTVKTEDVTVKRAAVKR